MTRSGPQYYPLASRSYWYEDTYAGSPMEVNCCGWHSTEGRALPSYGGGASAPTLTALPDIPNRRLVWFQHFRIDTSARSFRNAAGGVETNTANAVQVEVVGTCDRRHATSWSLGGRTYRAGTDYLYMGVLPDWAIRDLAEFAKWLRDQHGVPLTSGLRWPAYPESYGAGNGVRMSFAEWRAFTGHFGHMHVPENDHGDPGQFPMAAILARAAGTTTTEEDPDMPLTSDDAKKVWMTDFVKTPVENPDNPTWAPATFLRDTNLRVRALQGTVAAQGATIQQLVKAVADLAAGVTELDADALIHRIEAAIEGVTIHLDVPGSPASQTGPAA